MKAPTFSELRSKKDMGWRAVESWDMSQGPLHLSVEGGEEGMDEEWIMPRATFAAASQRISEMYKNVIFNDMSGADEQEEMTVDATENGTSGTRIPLQDIHSFIPPSRYNYIHCFEASLSHTKSYIVI